MDKSKLCFFLLLFFLSACRNKPTANDGSATIQPDSTDTALSPADSLFDLQKYKAHFLYKNHLSTIPFIDSAVDNTIPAISDRNIIKAVYQDSVDHFSAVDAGAGNGMHFYAYIDTYAGFNLICMYTGRGDGGDVYDLLTYTKSGRRIADLQAAWLQGEEDVWAYNQRATVTGKRIDIYATACRTTFDSTGIAVGSVCDTLRSYYQLLDNGEITLLRKDSVLNPALDSIRKALPYQ
jgi:hypothetical protein